MHQRLPRALQVIWRRNENQRRAHGLCEGSKEISARARNVPQRCRFWGPRVHSRNVHAQRATSVKTAPEEWTQWYCPRGQKKKRQNAAGLHRKTGRLQLGCTAKPPDCNWAALDSKGRDEHKSHWKPPGICTGQLSPNIAGYFPVQVPPNNRRASALVKSHQRTPGIWNRTSPTK